jgi:lipoate-protein ligase A
MRYIRSDRTDPYYNLALEEYLFKYLEDDIFMLWQNNRTIVIGNYQNTLEEISCSYVKENDIHVVRRMSGGGAVYHDLGNINFTFITRESESGTFDFAYFTKAVIKTLEEYGIRAEFTGRNDLTIEGKKFSGNAQYRRAGRILHHGTILFNSDLEAVVKALNVSDVKIQSKAIQSVKERVTNVKEHLKQPTTIESFMDSLVRQVSRENEMYPLYLTKEEERMIKDLRNQKYATWEWNYGVSPGCDLIKRKKHNSGMVETRINIERGKISTFKYYGDFFALENIAEVERAFIGAAMEENSIMKVLKTYGTGIRGIDADWMLEYLLY